jgi:hypothetical protein
MIMSGDTQVLFERGDLPLIQLLVPPVTVLIVLSTSSEIKYKC